MTELANYLTPVGSAGFEWNEQTLSAITAGPSASNRVVVEYFVSDVLSTSDGERTEIVGLDQGKRTSYSIL